MKEDQESTPLRIVLQNFINHVEKLETYRSENSYEKDFQDLKLFSENLRSVGEYSCKEGEKEINRKKNRYKDILPFDYSRVTLSEYAGVPGSDYINANYIKGASGSPAYIASQGPLPHTVNDFWRMVVECEVQVIVMACNEEESGKHKCENYWVDKEGEEKEFGMATIRLLKASTICPDFLVRTMHLKYMNSHSMLEERVVCQFHYGAWPDHGVPGLVRPLLEMVRLVRDTQASETLPVLVHCSAGCGRTGTICAIDYVWGLLRAGKLKLDFSLFKLVRDMRKQRIAMVQTKDQYILVHQAVKELFQDQLRMIHSHPYENIDIRGHPIAPTFSSKARVLNPGDATKEKQDHTEKENCVVSRNEEEAPNLITVATDIPPLPHKKRIHLVSSKQEKEVENLTQKQLSIAFGKSRLPSFLPDCGNLAETGDKDKRNEQPLNTSKTVSNTCNCVSPPTAVQAECVINEQKQCIAKLKALFESNASMKEARACDSSDLKLRSPQLVTRSHSLGAVRKPKKFTQFNTVAVETETNVLESGRLNENDKFKSVSSIHVEISSGDVKEVATVTCKLKKLHQMHSVPMSSHNAVHSEVKSICEPLASLHVSKPLSTAVELWYEPCHMAEELSVTEKLSDSQRPALPIKRSKSLKAQMVGENFKLSLAKRSYGQSQELATADNCSILPYSLNGSSLELKSVSKANDVPHISEKVPNCPFYKGGISGEFQRIPRTARIELSETDHFVNKRQLEINESHTARTGCISEVAQDFKGGLFSSKIRKSSAESKYLTECSEMKKDSIAKANCDVCRARSLKREKSCHTLMTWSQGSEFVNTKISGPSNIMKVCEEPLTFRSPSNDISEKSTEIQQQKNSLFVDAYTVYEHCNNYLMSVGGKVSESQRIANARHKVDTIIGGLGIRERRNSFRCAVGVDDDTVTTNKTSRNFESVQCDESAPKIQLKSSCSVKKQENKELARNSSLRNEETSAIFKSPADFQKLTRANDFKYVAGVQKPIETHEEVNSAPNELANLADLSPNLSDITPQYVRPRKKTLIDSFDASPLKQHSVGVSDGNVAYPSVMQESTTQLILLNSTKSSSIYKATHYLPPSQQASSIHQKEEILKDSTHASERVITQQNPNLVVTSEVDVDQVGARMRHQFVDNSQGEKCVDAPENNSHGSTLTHFSRALEVFHQTAANIRTKFSKSTGSGANSVKSSESSPQMNPVIPSYSASLKIHHNGKHKRGKGSVCDKQKTLKKQQQYL